MQPKAIDKEESSVVAGTPPTRSVTRMSTLTSYLT